MPNSTPHLDVRKLLALIAVSESRTLAAAARRAGLSISGLRYQLDDLTRVVGVPLVEITPAGPLVTPAGQAMLVGAPAVLAGVNRLIEDARDASAVDRPVLRIAAPWPVVYGVLSRGAEPGNWAAASWQLHTAGRTDAVAAVRAGTADVAIAADWQGDPIRVTDGLTASTLFEADYRLAVSADSALGLSRRPLQVAQTAESAWAVPMTDAGRVYLDRQLHRCGLAPQLVGCAEPLEYMTLIDTGVAVGLAEPITARFTFPNTVFVPVAGLEPYRYFIAYRTELEGDPRLAQLRRYCSHVGRQFAA